MEGINMKNSKLEDFKDWCYETIPIPKMVAYFFLIFILGLIGLIVLMRYQKRYLYGLGEDEGYRTDISNKCFETLDGKFCMVPKKVMWYERTDR
jgi:hypothetical protein